MLTHAIRCRRCCAIVQRLVLASVLLATVVNAAPRGTAAFGTNGKDLCSIDLHSGNAELIVELGGNPSANVSVSPGAGIVYVGTYTGLQSQPGAWQGSAVKVVDTRANAVVRTILERPWPAYFPVLAPDGGSLYVAPRNDGGVGGTLLRYAAPAGTLLGSVTLAETPSALAVAPNGRTVVVATDRGLTFVDTDSNRVVKTLSTDGPATSVVISADGAMAYASTRRAEGGAVVGVALSTSTVSWTIDTPSWFTTLAVKADGTRLYAITSTLRDVQVINTVLRQIVTSFSTQGLAYGLAVAPGDELLLVSSDGYLQAYSTATNNLVNGLAGCGALFAAGSDFVGPKGASLPRVIEYYHAGFGHYFLTNNAAEIDALDLGQLVGWSRTGQSFAADLKPGPIASPVCRFFTTAFGAKSSHFYAPRGLGCESTLLNADWMFEGEVFFARLPDSSGSCPAGWEPIYRVYNNGLGGAPNHRYSASLVVRSEMLAQGWIAEGAGMGVGWCAPALLGAGMPPSS